MSGAKIFKWAIPVLVLTAPLLGFVFFLLSDSGGSFWSITGLRCTAAALLAEIVLPVTVLKALYDGDARDASRHSQVHGAARPASQAEAQAAASGSTKKGDIHDQTFPD